MKKRTRNRKLLTALLLIMVLCCTNVFGITAIASEGTKVSKIRINVANDDGEVEFTSAEKEKYIVTYPTDEITASVGDTNVDFEVVVHVNEGYYFDDISKGDISFKKDSSGVKCTDVSYDLQEAKLDIEIKTIKGKLEKPDSAWWDEDDFGVARWDDVEAEGVTGYTISINGNELTTNGKTYKDLSDYLKWGKNNYFRVKATSTRTGVIDSSYVKSDKLDLTDDGDYWNDYYYNNYDYGVSPGITNYNNYGWIQYNGKWYFLDKSGEMEKGWLELSGNKYYFDKNGEMVTGWQKISGSWYYFVADGHMLRNTSLKSANAQFDYYLNADGKMLTNRWQKNQFGWYYIGNDEPLKNCEKKIDGKYYRFNDAGYMITGWWYDGKDGYYYYNTDGSKAKDTIVWSNGGYFKLDKNGKWTY